MVTKCPYCNESVEIELEYSEFEENVKHHAECCNCNKSFVFETVITIEIESFKADCLNDENHTFELSKTYPIECSKMVCSACGTKRLLTDSERKEFGIGTVDDYFKSLNQNG